MNEASPMATGLRTHQCGALRLEHVNQTVRLGGWVHRSRNLGGLVFVDVRDRTGLLQVSFNPQTASPDVLAVAERLTAESVVLVEGVVVARPTEGRRHRYQPVHADDESAESERRIPDRALRRRAPGRLLRSAARVPAGRGALGQDL